jgi:hypothetical protein
LVLITEAIDRPLGWVRGEPKPPKNQARTKSQRRVKAKSQGRHAITDAQMRHRDPRMTLRVYTDVTGMRPRTRLGGLLGDADWAAMGRNADLGSGKVDSHSRQTSLKHAQMQALQETGATGLEPATSGVTGRRSNQLSYAP